MLHDYHPFIDYIIVCSQSKIFIVVSAIKILIKLFVGKVENVFVEYFLISSSMPNTISFVEVIFNGVHYSI